MSGVDIASYEVFDGFAISMCRDPIRIKKTHLQTSVLYFRNR